MDAAVMQQRRLRDDAARLRRADGAPGRGLGGDFLHGFEAVAFSAFIFVKWHVSQGAFRYHGYISGRGVSNEGFIRLAQPKSSWYKTSCLPTRANGSMKPRRRSGFFFTH